jgi:hypothetical protein
VALDRLAEDALLPDPGDEHLLRHLALAEPVDLDGGGEVGRGVLDRVLELVRRHVDREANFVVGELFDACSHQGGIVAVSTWATAELCGWRDSNPHDRRSPQRLRRRVLARTGETAGFPP